MRFVILGDPIAQKRARACMGWDQKIHVYDSQKKEKLSFAEELDHQMYLAYHSEDLYIVHEATSFTHAQCFHVEATFYMPIPKSTPKKRAGEMIGKCHSSKPDGDNLIKFVLDGMNKIVWKDDAKVCHLKIQKIYSDNPRTEIDVTVCHNMVDPKTSQKEC